MEGCGHSIRTFPPYLENFYVSYFRMSFFNFLCQKTARSSTFPLKTLALIFEIWNVLWKINSLSLTTKAVTYSCNCPFQRLIWKRRKKGIWIKFVILFHYNNKASSGILFANCRGFGYGFLIRSIENICIESIHPRKIGTCSYKIPYTGPAQDGMV